METGKEEPGIETGSTLSESSMSDATLSEEIPVRQVTGSNAHGGRSDPLTLAMRDFLALTRLVLPEPTYIHLKNAGREAFLAVFTLVDSMSNAVGTMTESNLRADDTKTKRTDVR
jgi:hypothetical protein